MQIHMSVLQRIVSDGRGIVVAPKQFNQTERNNAALAIAQQMCVQSNAFGAFGVFDNIVEQETLFNKFGRANASTGYINDNYGALSTPNGAINALVRARIVGGPAATPSWYPYINGKNLLVEIGAARPLTNAAFVELQIKDMERYGFRAILTTIEKPACEVLAKVHSAAQGL